MAATEFLPATRSTPVARKSIRARAAGRDPAATSSQRGGVGAQEDAARIIAGVTIFLGALTIFLLRIGDVTAGTLRVIFLVSGRRAPAMALAFCESAIWILAIRQVFKDPTPAQMLGYACGYACGTLVGISVDQLIGVGTSVVRVITRDTGSQLRDRLASEGFGLTIFDGQGVNGPIQELILVIPRRQRKRLIRHVHEIDPDAFITVEAAAMTYGGFTARPVRDHNK